MTTANLHLLTGAYALHALPDEESSAFERHLAGCEACARETAELSATATRLGLAVSSTPPTELRAQVLRRITTVRQETPGKRPQNRTALAGLRTRALSRWALAACLAAATALGGTAVWQHQRAEDARDRARQAVQASDEIAAVLAAPDARTRAAALAGAPPAPSSSHAARTGPCSWSPGWPGRRAARCTSCGSTTPGPCARPV